MGLADRRVIREASLGAALDAVGLDAAHTLAKALAAEATAVLGEGAYAEVTLNVRPRRSESVLEIALDGLEAEGWAWAQEILDKSPLAIRLLKSAFNADLDGQAGLQELAGNATMLYYMTEEAQEGKRAYVEKRKPEFRKYPWLPW